MKLAWRYFFTFAVGLLVGAVAAYAFLGWHWKRDFSNWYVLEVADQANVAREIYAGHGRELADRIQNTLPEYVRAIEREFSGNDGSAAALWMVSDVYRAAGTPAPPELQAVFAALPPRESCRLPEGPRTIGDAAR